MPSRDASFLLPPRAQSYTAQLAIPTHPNKTPASSRPCTTICVACVSNKMCVAPDLAPASFPCALLTQYAAVFHAARFSRSDSP